jgi:hypothetical protein
MTDRRWIVALGLSLLVHLTVIGSPGWHLPFLEEPTPNILLEAHIAPKPAPVVAPAPLAPPPKAKPLPKPAAPKPRPPQPMPEATAPAAPAPSPAPAVVAESPPPAAPVAAAPVPVELPWPHSGRIRFVVTRGEGEQGMQLGQSTHTWKHDGLAYKLQTVSETTGLVALFRAVSIVQTSEGELNAAGLVPREFRVERSGKTAEGVRFDWSANKAAMTSGGQVRREVALAPGSQDVLSQIYQIGLAGAAARVEMMIATGKNYGRYAYEAVGDETLATRFGALRTWHVKTPALPGEQAMELWLASDYRNLPVRIRFIDRKGEVFDQNAVELEVDGVRLATQEK